MISAPTPNTGRGGYRRESLILERSLHTQTQLVDCFTSTDIKRFEVVVAECAIRDNIAVQHKMLALSFAGVNTEPAFADVQSTVHIRTQPARNAFDISDVIALAGS